MKEKIFEYMRDIIGWNLNNNEVKDFDDVMQLHLRRMENRWKRLTNDDTLTDETLVEDLAFMIDLVRAINNLDKSSKCPNEEILLLDKAYNTQRTKDVIILNDKNLVGNETQEEMQNEISVYLGENQSYVDELENALMGALDKLSEYKTDFDYYDDLRELTNWGNFKALDFLDRLGSDNDE